MKANNQQLSLEHAEQKRVLDIIREVDSLVINAISLDQMLDQVLERFLSFFDCQRAWLLYPCLPDALAVVIPKEKTEPQWPGALAQNVEIPVDDQARAVFVEALKSTEPLTYDSTSRQVDEASKKAFSVASMMHFTIRPKIGEPWLVGIHHCGEERVYSDSDIALFKALGARIADGLSSLLYFKQTQESEALQSALLNHSHSPICIKDLNNNYILVNDYFRRLFDEDNLPLKDLHDDKLFTSHVASELKAQNDKVVRKKVSIEFEQTIKTLEGEKTFLSTHFPLFDENAQVYAIGTISTDISDRRRAEEKARHLAHYDYLTQLPNRRQIQKELKRALVNSVKEDFFGALIFIDLDNFKTLNDTKGHSYGDMLLKEAANILLNSVSKHDIVARFGGDEFIVILKAISNSEAQAQKVAAQVGDKLLKALNTVFVGDDFQHHVTASIGATLFHGSKHKAEELLKYVDSAMYLAKKAGRNNLQFFNPKLQEQLEYQAYLSAEMKSAIDRKEFHIYFQPQVGMEGNIKGAEALIRWLHEDKGMISPGIFIPLAEESDFIVKLGEWVIKESCKQLSIWSTQQNFKHLTLSVNVSAKQFNDPGFVDMVKSNINKYKTPVNKLKIELTESLEQDDINGNVLKMNALKELGITLSLDDFGTGFSSLNILRRLPIGQLKIDQSFVNDLGQDESCDVIAKTIIGMANNLNMDVIAEGVETQQQRDILLMAGCQDFQGYLYSPAIPIKAFEKLIEPLN